MNLILKFWEDPTVILGYFILARGFQCLKRLVSKIVINGSHYNTK